MKLSGIVALALAITALPLSAQSNDIGLWLSVAQMDDNDALTFDDAFGNGISFNHFWRSSLSTELAIHSVRTDTAIEVDGTPVLDTGRMKIRPITANVQWHFLREALVSPYVGAGVAYVIGSDLASPDLDLAGIGRVDIGNEATWNANAGVNIRITRAFGVAVDGRYIAYEPEATANESSEKVKLNPLVISAGVRLRF